MGPDDSPRAGSMPFPEDWLRLSKQHSGEAPMPLPRAADQGCAVGAASRIALHAARSVTRGRRARRGGSQPRGHTHAGSQRHHEDPELDEYEGMDDVGYILRSISGQQDFLQHVSLLLRHAAASSRRHAGSLAGLQCVTQRATSLGCRRGGGSSRYKRHAGQGGRGGGR